MFRKTANLSICLVASILVVCWGTTALSQDAARKQDFGPGKLSGYYSIHSGALGDEVLWPSRKDAKVRFTVTGRAASRMFDYMGSGATQKDACEDRLVYRARLFDVHAG